MFAVNWMVDWSKRTVAPLGPTSGAFSTLLNQIVFPALIGMPLKFALIELLCGQLASVVVVVGAAVVDVVVVVGAAVVVVGAAVVVVGAAVVVVGAAVVVVGAAVVVVGAAVVVVGAAVVVVGAAVVVVGAAVVVVGAAVVDVVVVVVVGTQLPAPSHAPRVHGVPTGLGGFEHMPVAVAGAQVPAW